MQKKLKVSNGLINHYIKGRQEPKGFKVYSYDFYVNTFGEPVKTRSEQVKQATKEAIEQFNKKEARKQQVSEHIKRVREEERAKIELEYYLIPKELLDMTGISLERLKKLLIDTVRKQVKETLERLGELENE